MCPKLVDRQTGRDRDSDRQTDRDRDRDRDRDSDRQTETATDRQTDRETETDRQTDRRTVFTFFVLVVVCVSWICPVLVAVLVAFKSVVRVVASQCWDY